MTSTAEVLAEKAALAAELDRKMRERVLAAVDDPVAFALLAFPWGEGELAEFSGPDTWQMEALEAIRDGLSWEEPCQDATASGHGVGKTAFLAILALWAMVRRGCRGTITANTGEQLRTKTWPELAKWYRLCLVRDLWELSATSLRSSDQEQRENWRLDMVTWSEENPAAFAGLHNAGSRIILIMDEASEIAPVIWETAEGALTDANTQIVWVACGNRTQPTGRFNDCFGRLSHRWKTRCIDSRTARASNKALLARWAQDYGEDSDFFKVRVRGLAPAVAEQQLLGADEIEAAFNRHYREDQYAHASVVLGVDVARQGSDESVIARRQGLVAWPSRAMRIPDTTLLADCVAREWSNHRADGCLVDGTGGYGAGVVDCLRTMGRRPIEVQFAGQASDPDRCFNKRSEMYLRLRDWVRGGGAIPRDELLKEELLATTYAFRGDRFQVCAKDEVKARIGRSPDRTDALALTFAFEVARQAGSEHDLHGKQNPSHDYDPFEPR